jgi:hypothetical protein
MCQPAEHASASAACDGKCRPHVPPQQHIRLFVEAYRKNCAVMLPQCLAQGTWGSEWQSNNGMED